MSTEDSATTPFSSPAAGLTESPFGGEPAVGGPSPIDPPQVATAPNMLPMAEPERYTNKLAAIYVLLGIVLVGSLAGLVVLIGKPGEESGPKWSSWTPKNGSVASMSQQIADQVSQQYRTAEDGGPLVSVAQSEPLVVNRNVPIPIRAIAVRKKPQSDVGVRTVNDTSNIRFYTLCGLGANCAINGGTPSAQRGRLLRREALEAALYTFKYVPSIDSVIAYMPPAPGEKTANVLFLEKDQLEDQLKQPLNQTLPLATPPLPDSENLAEAGTIDKLTLKSLFTYQYAAIQTGGYWIILDPAS